VPRPGLDIAPSLHDGPSEPWLTHSLRHVHLDRARVAFATYGEYMGLAAIDDAHAQVAAYIVRKEYASVAIYTVLVADVFEILADPTRRRLIEALRKGERSVNELVDEVDINQPGVSRQLRLLHEAGFVEVRPDAQRRLYSLRAEPFRELDDWMNDYRQLWDARFDKLAAHFDSQRPHKKKRTRT
jgi:DNA-binding transcriptional ArsR family regulator